MIQNLTVSCHLPWQEDGPKDGVGTLGKRTLKEL